MLFASTIVVAFHCDVPFSYAQVVRRGSSDEAFYYRAHFRGILRFQRKDWGEVAQGRHRSVL